MRPLASFTLGFLVFYVPIETWSSWPELWDPFYLDAAIGIALLLWGAVQAPRVRQPALGVLGAGYAWMSASGWRSTFGRVEQLAQGEPLTYGAAEMCFVVCSTALTMVGLVWSLVLVARPQGESR